MTNPIKSTSNKIIVLLVCAVLSFCLICSVSAQSSTIMNAQASTNQPTVGSTLTVNLTISNVQNLGGIDTTITWNPSVLSLTNSVLNLGDSHSNGVLHGSKLNTDSSNLNSGDIYVQETKVSGSYHLVAQSIGASNPGFTGSGTIATLTFRVADSGSAGLTLQTDLADHPAAGSTSNLIDHQDTADSVTTVVSGSSNTPTIGSSSTPTSKTSSTPATPEFPIITILIVFIALATTAIALAAKQLNKNKLTSKTRL
jgi:Cohesin domain